MYRGGGGGSGGSGTGALTPSQIATQQNSLALMLPKWRRGIARVKNGSGNARMAWAGDSIFYGFGSTGSTSPITQNFPPKSMPADVSAYLNSSGVNAHWNSFWGNGNGTNLGSDFRLSGGVGWINGSFDNTIGGQIWYTPSSVNTAPLSFTPTTPVDTFVIYYRAGSSGAIGANINGGTASTVNTFNGGTSALLTLTLTAGLGANTLNIYNNGSMATVAYIVGVEAWDSSKSWVSVANMGWESSEASNWTANFGATWPIPSIQAIGADLWLLGLGVNDYFGQVSIATYTSQKQQLITAALMTGDVVMVTQTPNINNFPIPLSSYAAADIALANLNNIPVVDIYGRWVSYTETNSLGYYSDGGTHPNGFGYQDQAQSIWNIIGNP